MLKTPMLDFWRGSYAVAAYAGRRSEAFGIFSIYPLLDEKGRAYPRLGDENDCVMSAHISSIDYALDER